MKTSNPRALCAWAAAPLLALGLAASSAHAAPAASAPAAAATAPGYCPGYGRGYGPGYGYGMGPGMMNGPGWGGGYGPGEWHGGAGPGWHHGWGPGWEGGGPGWQGGGGWGPGMMGGWGPGVMGGMGPWMMGGFGPWGSGLGRLQLSDAQQHRIEAIEQAQSKKQWALMTDMHTLMLSHWQDFDRSKVDIDAVMKTAKAMSDLRLQMLRNRLETAQQIREVLTPQQREQLRSYGPWGR